MERSEIVDVGEPYDVYTKVPNVSQEIAESLGRPAQAHMLVQTYQNFYDYTESPNPIRSKRLIAEHRLFS